MLAECLRIAARKLAFEHAATSFLDSPSAKTDALGALLQAARQSAASLKHSFWFKH
jgi:hypothetical protein